MNDKERHIWNDLLTQHPYHEAYERLQQIVSHKDRITIRGSMSTAEVAAQAPVERSDFRVEVIENGFILAYSCRGVSERRRYAASMGGLAEQVVAAMVEMKLRGTQAQGG
jgi:hypothetical protein